MFVLLRFTTVVLRKKQLIYLSTWIRYNISFYKSESIIIKKIMSEWKNREYLEALSGNDSHPIGTHSNSLIAYPHN